jgi:hypothetical protein
MHQICILIHTPSAITKKLMNDFVPSKKLLQRLSMVEAMPQFTEQFQARVTSQELCKARVAPG